MSREIAWSDESEDHIARHGVTPAEVEQVIRNRPLYEVHGRNETTLLHGQTDAGRYLLVVLAEASDGRDQVITAREQTDSERRTFRRKGT